MPSDEEVIREDVASDHNETPNHKKFLNGTWMESRVAMLHYRSKGERQALDDLIHKEMNK